MDMGITGNAPLGITGTAPMAALTWESRMAADMSQNYPDGPKAETIKLALDAAGEMKTVKLKMLLGQCYTLLYSINEDQTPAIPSTLLSEIVQAIK